MEMRLHLYTNISSTSKVNFYFFVFLFLIIFQELLQKYQAQIADVNDVKCMYLEGDENSLLPVSM